MTDVLEFFLIGIGTGALYALAGQGLVVVYRGSGILNLSFGSTALVGAYVSYEMQNALGAPLAVSMVTGIAASSLIGALVYLIVMRRLQDASGLAKLVGTLAVLMIIQAALTLKYQAFEFIPLSPLPNNIVNIFGATIPISRFILVAIAIAVTGCLVAFYRFTTLGLASSAVSENIRASSSLGWSPNNIALMSWVAGGAIAGTVGVLLSSVTVLSVDLATDILLSGLAAALVGGFTSFPLTLLGGMAVGVLESEMTRYVPVIGLPQAAPLLLIVFVMIVRGKSLPVRGSILQRMPTMGTGILRWKWISLAVAATAVLLFTLNSNWSDALTTSMACGIVLLSIVVVVGYTGQLSLAQFALAGIGAFIAGRLAATLGLPFLLVLVIAIVAAVPIGAVLALPAIRTRGVNLAIVTLSLAQAVTLVLFANAQYTGGPGGTTVPNPNIFGLSLNPTTQPGRYGLFTLVALVLAGAAVANVRRGRVGRRLVAVRANERAAAALGIRVASAKLYAFCLGSALAALGGVLLGFQSPTIVFSTFTTFQSISFVGFTVIGGVGYITGPVFGSLLPTGGVASMVGDSLFANFESWLALVSGILLLLTILRDPNGIASDAIRGIRAIRARSMRARQHHPADKDAREEARSAVGQAKASLTKTTGRNQTGSALRVTDLEVRFGGVCAVNGVSFAVQPGKVFGLIGPNGAGKTTVIDAMTGFVRPTRGTISLGNQVLNGLSPAQRAAAGVIRSFQSLELFEDITVGDNLRTASDSRDALGYLTDIVRPGNAQLNDRALTAVAGFGLWDDLDRLPVHLPYGRRRLVAIARAVACAPAMLLLDEPAAGLSDHESAELADLLRRLAADWDIGIVLIEHNMQFVMGLCHEILVLNFGQSLAVGSPAAIRRDPAVVAAYLGAPPEAASDEKSRA
jgi:ABC-type branched-subunit amino acid transport system ATPase component/ABC-type branched-subunit amino acid transport system permease subunit